MKVRTFLSKVTILITLLFQSTLFQSTYCFNLRNIATFAKGFFKNPTNVGSPFPCSSSVGYELVKYIKRAMEYHPSRPLRILEVGAGTGGISNVLARILRPIDQLDLIEISSDYCKMLQKKFEFSPGISVHCTAFHEYNSEASYDFIISTLPLNSFNPELINKTINHFKKLIKPGAILSYVSIAGMAQAKQYLSLGKTSQKYAHANNLLKKFRNKYQISATTIMANCPPLRIYHLQILP